MSYFIVIIIIAFVATALIIGRAGKAAPALALAATLNYESIVPTASSDPVEVSFEEQWQSAKPELLLDTETVQLMEADKLLEQVDEIVATNHDVYVKLKAAVSRNAVLFDADFRSAIEKYIRLVVQEDCQLELSAQELTALWV